MLCHHGLTQVAERVRTDPRVVVLERSNLRYVTLESLPGQPQPVDLVTLDLSFISVLKVMPTICSVLKPGGYLMVLIKPQFEAAKEQVTLQYTIHCTRICVCAPTNVHRPS